MIHISSNLESVSYRCLVCREQYVFGPAILNFDAGVNCNRTLIHRICNTLYVVSFSICLFLRHNGNKMADTYDVSVVIIGHHTTHLTGVTRSLRSEMAGNF